MKWQYIRFFVVGMILLALAGCKAKYISVPEYHTEYVVRSDTVARLDSICFHDSVFVYHNGDTVIVNKVAYRDRYHNIYKVRLDTVFRRDSVSIPCPVERTLTKGEQRLITLGRLFVGFIFLFVGCVVLLFFWYHNKKG